MNGIVILNKESGISSFKASKKVGYLLNEKKVGNLGTLDPAAEGVLPIMLGKCCKLFDYYLHKTKTYEAEFTFGYETDTLDRDGKTIKDGGSIPSKNDILHKLNELTGEISQVPPQYSAKKINGKKACDLARNNQFVELKPTNIVVYKFELLNYNKEKCNFLIECSSGTYIRSLCRDLAYLLNTLATMTKLKRTKVGNFEIENAYLISEIEQIKEKSVIKVEDAIELNRIDLSDEEFVKLKNGVKIKLKSNDEKLFAFYKDELAFFVEKIDDLYKVYINFL